MSSLRDFENAKRRLIEAAFLVSGTSNLAELLLPRGNHIQRANNLM